MKHAYAELFTEKLNDTSLVLFEKHQEWKEWREVSRSDLVFTVGGNFEYFLCLPQHKQFCLHWLNGGDVIVRDHPDDERERVLLSSGYSNWHAASVFMCEKTVIRIKPKKEKRWIIWNENQDAYHCTFLTNPSGIYEANFKFSTHEIEVEVTN